MERVSPEIKGERQRNIDRRETEKRSSTIKTKDRHGHTETYQTLGVLASLLQ